MGAGKPTTTNIVTAILQHGEKILILKRSKKVRTMRMMWAGISGYIEDETPLERALKEIKEETGLTNDSVVLVHIGQPIEAVEPSMPWLTWIVHPFLFYSNTVLIKIDWEHEEYKWITPEEIVKYRTVPRLRDVVDLLFHNKSN
jgi:8-oxo-dGTP pyrophosphatase MutT (NUDIX family)